MYLRDVHSAKPTAASVSNAAKSLRILRRLREIISQRGVKVTFKVRANADAEPLGRWPQGKAMKASVATATRYDSVACDEGRFIFPEESQASLNSYSECSNPCNPSNPREISTHPGGKL